MTISSIAIIPARGGSKALPRKNVLPLAGKPLLGWTIEAAQHAKLVEQVVVSTDNPEIAEVSEHYGAEVVWRPASISGDLSPSEEAILHALDTMEKKYGRLPAITTFLQCTAPLTTDADIDGTIHALVSDAADTSLAVADFHYFVWERDNEHDFIGINHDKKIRQMRQERAPQYIETGSVYAMRTADFRKQRHRFFGKTAHYVMPSDRVLEIDEPADFRIAQILLGERLKRKRLEHLPKKIDLVVFDFDGVFTDDRVSVTQNGVESVICSRSDGMGVALARQAGVPMMLLSSEVNEVVRQRAEKLQIPVIHGVGKKHNVLEDILKDRNIRWENVVYVGNDVNDIQCLLNAGCGIAVANAHPRAIFASRIILDRDGGNHAVREVLDLLLQHIGTGE
jgi:YrbI family 3-deoxy-D-manno-octulosonate 8-phosphate phosphatase